MTEAHYPPPLEGLRVLDLSQVAAGPYATSLLGDMGADVVKVESPAGDPFRAIDEDFGPGDSGYFFGINRSKRCIALDLQTEVGQEVLRRIVAQCDVVIVGFRPDVVLRLGLDFETLRAVNSRLVYCSLTAFGEDGPRATEPGMDILAQAISGVMGLTGEPGRPPVKVGPPIADFVASFLMGFAICAALLARDRDGVGQKLSVNLLDGQVATLANYVTPFLRTGTPIRPVGGGHPQLVPYQVFEAADGYFVLACLSDKFWDPLARATGIPGLESDTRFTTNADRVAHREVLVSMLQTRFRSDVVASWLSVFIAADVPCGPVHRLEDALSDPQVVHNRMLMELTHPRHGAYTTVNNPVRFGGTPLRPWGYAPDLGEHSRAVLHELGYTAAEIGGFLDDGVLVQSSESAAQELLSTREGATDEE